MATCALGISHVLYETLVIVITESSIKHHKDYIDKTLIVWGIWSYSFQFIHLLIVSPQHHSHEQFIAFRFFYSVLYLMEQGCFIHIEGKEIDTDRTADIRSKRIECFAYFLPIRNQLWGIFELSFHFQFNLLNLFGRKCGELDWEQSARSTLNDTIIIQPVQYFVYMRFYLRTYKKTFYIFFAGGYGFVSCYII